ncbi:hypothetical protein niasHT_032517 [Heterodera trifolii]|uniref:Uncharacterized protein n=1 Tax=Heterodera trifolii TaxID=157864 RepID=A0ABD2ITL1_9BILA
MISVAYMWKMIITNGYEHEQELEPNNDNESGARPCEETWTGAWWLYSTGTERPHFVTDWSATATGWHTGWRRTELLKPVDLDKDIAVDVVALCGGTATPAYGANIPLKDPTPGKEVACTILEGSAEYILVVSIPSIPFPMSYFMICLIYLVVPSLIPHPYACSIIILFTALNL